MARTHRQWVLSLAFSVPLVCPPSAAAQAQPADILRQVIQQLQTGRPNPAWYGEALWLLIAVQTNWSGVYPQLVQLGPVQRVTVTSTVPLPLGVGYYMTAQHRHGSSDWELAVSSLSNRIEHLGFQSRPGAAAAPAAPGGDLEKPAPAPPKVDSADKGSGSEACRKFPNLC